MTTGICPTKDAVCDSQLQGKYAVRSIPLESRPSPAQSTLSIQVAVTRVIRSGFAFIMSGHVLVQAIELHLRGVKEV